MLVTLRRTDHMKVEFTPYELLSKVLFQVPKMSTSILLVSQSLSLSLSPSEIRIRFKLSLSRSVRSGSY